MDICYISDDNFAMILGTSILSLVKNNLKEKITIHLIDTGISGENINKLKSIINGKNITLVFYRPDSLIQSLKSKGFTAPVENNSLSTIIRLFLPLILPTTIKKLLYIDCDTIVCSELYSLYHVNLNGKALAGVIDANYDFLFDKRTGYKKESYINAGVLLIDFEMYSKIMKTESIMRILTEHPLFADQDVINTLLKDQIKIIDPKFNLTIKYRLADSKDLAYWINWRLPYSSNKIDQGRANPIIMHFTSSLLGRPWEKNCMDPQKALWLNYYFDSPWNESKLNNKRLSVTNKLGRIVYSLFPRKIYYLIDYRFERRKFYRKTKR